VVPTCAEAGISQIVWSPIAQGVLTGKYLPGQPAPTGTRATDSEEGANMIANWLRDDVLTAVQGLLPIASDLGLTPAQLAIAWVLANPNVASALVGASRPDQISDNVKAAGVKLDADVLAAIDDVLGDVVSRDPALTASPNPRP
jgi:aryl-alcohol dehydrogenase-like predicted oxidoreductase